MKNKLTYSLSLFFFAFFILGWYWTEGYGFTNTDVTGDSIEEAIFRYTLHANHIHSQAEIIEKIELEDDKFLVFTVDVPRIGIHAGIVKKKWNGKWKVETMTGGAPFERGAGETNPYYWGRFSSGYWGVIYDSNVKAIVIENNNIEDHAGIINAFGFPPIWYKHYPVQDLDHIEIKALDKSGNEIPWDQTNQ